VTDKQYKKYNTLISEQPYIHIHICPVVNFHISGTKWASSGTRDTVGQFRDDPSHSGTVGKPNLFIKLYVIIYTVFISYTYTYKYNFIYNYKLMHYVEQQLSGEGPSLDWPSFESSGDNTNINNKNCSA